MEGMTSKRDMVERAAKFYYSLPHCCGYPKCDGELVGLEHEPECPMYGKDKPSIIDILVDFALAQMEPLQYTNEAWHLAAKNFKEAVGLTERATQEAYINRIEQLKAAEAKVAELFQADIKRVQDISRYICERDVALDRVAERVAELERERRW